MHLVSLVYYINFTINYYLSLYVRPDIIVCLFHESTSSQNSFTWLREMSSNRFLSFLFLNIFHKKCLLRENISFNPEYTLIIWASMPHLSFPPWILSILQLALCIHLAGITFGHKLTMNPSLIHSPNLL